MIAAYSNADAGTLKSRSCGALWLDLNNRDDSAIAEEALTDREKRGTGRVENFSGTTINPNGLAATTVADIHYDKYIPELEGSIVPAKFDLEFDDGIWKLCSFKQWGAPRN
ncbi:hypothetical protein [Nocardia sp. NPDC050175]|uniref:hypothetical protein n=1 Tax=Nocardia sp. NPDC050175 TaxID=3364317 RepID=UPI0037AA8233